ncbi:(4Fe-4S)-binding protein, partial [Candidatus Bipolaricaulota bacterium]|nr:(4Fe-4S)-binding protein [Candidatus Bipolaricaulota bacterium]
MKSILFLSGKGGTGKTSLAGAFAVLSKDKVLTDCDVDAANLHLLLDPEITE